MKKHSSKTAIKGKTTYRTPHRFHFFQYRKTAKIKAENKKKN